MEIRINITKKTFAIIGNCTANELVEAITSYKLQGYTFEGSVEVVKDATWLDKLISPPSAPSTPWTNPYPPIWYTTSKEEHKVGPQIWFQEHTLTEEQERELVDSQKYYK